MVHHCTSVSGFLDMLMTHLDCPTVEVVAVDHEFTWSFVVGLAVVVIAVVLELSKACLQTKIFSVLRENLDLVQLKSCYQTERDTFISI